MVRKQTADPSRRRDDEHHGPRRLGRRNRVLGPADLATSEHRHRDVFTVLDRVPNEAGKVDADHRDQGIREKTMHVLPRFAAGPPARGE